MSKRFALFFPDGAMWRCGCFFFCTECSALRSRGLHSRAGLRRDFSGGRIERRPNRKCARRMRRFRGLSDAMFSEILAFGVALRCEEKWGRQVSVTEVHPAYMPNPDRCGQSRPRFACSIYGSADFGRRDLPPQGKARQNGEDVASAFAA